MRTAESLIVLTAVCVCAGHAPGAVARPAPSSSAGQAQGSSPAAFQAAAPSYLFPSGAGMLFFYVKPDKAPDFEAVATRMAELLDRTDDPVRKQQAAGWRVLKSVEAARDQAIYVFTFDPAIAGADYDPVKWLGAADPAEVQSLYARLKDATIRVERMGLARLR